MPKEEKVFKLNLSQIKKDHNINEEASITKEEDPIIEGNSSTIKEEVLIKEDEPSNDKDDSIVKEDEPYDDENDSIIKEDEPSNDKDDSIDLEEALIKEETSEETEKVEESEEGNIPKLNLSAIKTEKKVKKEEIIEEKVKKEEKKEKKKIFTTYKSDFIKKETSILEKIKKLKNLPKTRKGFLAMIIIPSILTIGMLFIVAPDKHNIQVYKYGLIKIYGQITGNPVKVVSETKTPEQTNSYNNGQEEENMEEVDTEEEVVINTKEKTIKKHGITIDYETEEVDGKEVINYNGAIYDSLEAFKKDLEKEIDRIKKKKLAEFFKK